MKIEELLNSNLSVDMGRRLLQLQPILSPGAVPLGQIDLEHDAVYFGADSSPKSFSGHLSEGLEDEEVIEYIRRNNLALHERLWGKRWNQLVEQVTSIITGPRDLSGRTGGDSPPNDVSNGLDSEIVGTPDTSNESWACRSTPFTLSKSAISMTRFESCGGDVLLTPSSKDSALRAAESALRSKKELQQDLYLLQQRRYIQSLLLNNHILVLQKVPPAEAKVRSRSCDHPLCRYRHGIPPGTYRLSLESKRTLDKSTATTDKYYSPKDEDSGKYLKVRSTNSRGFYCLTCIEGLFSGIGMLDDDYTTSPSTEQASLVPDSLNSAPISVDGGSDENLGLRPIILEAAEKLLPCVRLTNEARIRTQTKFATEVTIANMFGVSGGQMAIDLMKYPNSDTLAETSAHADLEGLVAHQFPSNSDDTLLLRDTKRRETEATLQLLYQVAYKQEVRGLSRSLGDDELPSLRILRPIDLPRPEERYKKQGLGVRDWRLWRSSLLATHAQDDNAAPITIDGKAEDDHHHLAPVEKFCYCRQPDDLKGMVQCGAEFCLIGWVHLKCSGLPRIPVGDETWFCSECSALFGPGTFDPALVVVPEYVVESNRVLRSNVRAASRFVDRNESGNLASDELSTDETSLPLSDDELVDPTYTLPVTPRRQSKSAVGMNFTPYEFLDGAGEDNSAVRSPITTEEIIPSNNSVPATPGSIKDELQSAEHSLTRTKRASTLTLQNPDAPSTPTKRLKRISSPPPPLTPPSRHIKTSFGHLAPFIHAETRTSAAALSNAQIVALEKWKSIHLYSPLTVIIESSRSEPLTLSSPNKNSQQAETSSTVAPNIATLELGGTVIDLPSIHGKNLSQILSEVDTVVENELCKQGSFAWEQGVHARDEAVKIGKARGSQVDEQNGLTSPKAANEVRRRISKSFSGSKDVK